MTSKLKRCTTCLSFKTSLTQYHLANASHYNETLPTETISQPNIELFYFLNHLLLSLLMALFVNALMETFHIQLLFSLRETPKFVDFFFVFREKIILVGIFSLLIGIFTKNHRKKHETVLMFLFYSVIFVSLDAHI